MARSRFRSVRFDLEAAVAVARIVENAGGTVAPDLLAAGLGYSGTNNGTYLTRLANARTFGLLSGRGDRIDLTDRGRLILAGDEPLASSARREAFLSVPLFRAVLESLPPGTALPDRSALAATLCLHFGESEEKAPVVAAKLLDSARQAGLARVGSAGNFEVRGLSPIFTTVENRLPGFFRKGVVKFRRAPSGDRSPSIAAEDRGGDMNDDQLWLDEGPQAGPDPAGRTSPWRRAGVVAAAVACLALVAVPVGVALTGTSVTPGAQKHHPPTHPAKVQGAGPAEHQVLGALSATTDSGSFDFAYNLKTTPATQPVPTTTTTTICHTLQVRLPPGVSGITPDTVTFGAPGGGFIQSGSSSVGSASASSSRSSTKLRGGTSTTPSRTRSGTARAPTVVPGTVVQNQLSTGSGNGTQTITECSAGPAPNPGTPVSGTGISNTNPKATLIDATLGPDNAGLKVSLRVDSTTLYEDLSSLETGLAPPPSMAHSVGQPISGFANITEGTIGSREGAIAMVGMASATGYLDLYQQDINGATQTGTSTVNGVPVTVYQVAVDPTQLAGEPNLTSEESKTATDAIAVLHAQGYTGTTDEVSIDASGFIREVNSVAHFSDGGTVVLDVTLSNFGCAGTVLMPGQQGPDAPPSGCTSPDTGQPPTAPASSPTAPAPTTTTTQASVTTTTTMPTTSTTVPPGTTTTTIPSTTSTTS